LGELISGRVDSHQVVIQRAASGLHAMGPGIMPANHIIDLEPPKFSSLINRLTEDYALVIVDGPPVNQHPESVLYGSQVDQALLTVYSGVTRVPVISKAISKLMTGNCKKVDILLNRRIFPIPEWIYNKL
jgi:tyrosine-protein kinase Etk/Wzc